MIVYKIDNNVYINLTNRCSNACSFCVRTTSDCYNEYDLWLKKEPTVSEVIEELKKYSDYENFVFCGYGEPLYRADDLIEIAKYLKGQNKNVRLNTNGQADLIVGEGLARKLKGKIDKVSISLNAGTASGYNAICRCKFGEEGFYSLLRFAEECKEQGIDTVFSIVKTDDADIDGAKRISEKYGIPLRIRELIK